MKQIQISAPLIALLFLSGCASINEGYKSYDPSRRYLATERYFSEPIKVPPTLSDNKLEEYYPVPNVGLQSKLDKPSLTPPSNTLRSESL